jgi:DNA mismatch repair protein MutS2
MNEHALRVLEYDKVRDIVAGFAASEPGRAAVASLAPEAGHEAVASLLEKTREFIRILERGESPPLDGIRDVRQPVEKLRVDGALLQPQELLDIASTLAAGRRLRNFFERQDGRSAGAGLPSAGLLRAMAARITPIKEIEDAVSAALDETGEVRDSASPGLRRVRKLIGRTREEILERMSRILRDSGTQKVVQEAVVTIRDDRYVLPLKPNFRQSLNGVVHGQSGSRATLFVEPLDILEQNNRLAELRMEEREEVERVLRELTATAARHAESIGRTADALAEIDAVSARARFGVEYRGTVPEVSERRKIRLRAARHPLLVWKKKGGGEAVPNDIELAEDCRALIISGPNAGGKTVVLKTLGLLCLMAQSGLPVTAAEGSALPVFSDVFADIGDEQSLEEDLSTFSSHVSRIAEILREARRDSLVLLDELGSGTDPSEGAALGAAVLSGLLARGCVSVVTTHHSALKLFGSRTEGAMNAAMEFDPETLKPTYRYIPGRPGRSYGLPMAERLGVPEEVIRDARSRLSEDEAGLGRLLEQIESDSREQRTMREQAEQELAAARKDREEAAALRKTASEDVRGMKTRAKQEAREVLSSLRQKLKDLSKRETLDRAGIRMERAAVEGLAGKLEPEEAEVFERPAAGPYEFHAGDRVRVPRLKKSGTVLSSHKDVIEVDAGGIKLRIPKREALPLEQAAAVKQASPARGWSAELEEHEGLPDRLNLLGLRVDEALAEVDRFIDRAGVAGFSIVTIIHGLGTGALKAAVTGFLKSHPLVSSIRPGEPAEGGAGVTVAELKK